MLLDGITVVDLTRRIPGPYATLMLAELGADVIKIEDPDGGDPARGRPPLSGGVGAMFQLLNRQKRSVALDLRVPQARDALDALIAQADVCIEGYRPDTARRLGVDGEMLTSRHPRLVHCSISGFGRDGPYAGVPGHDLTYAALAGLLALDDEAGGPVRVPRLLVVDVATAYQAAIGILAALVARGRTGQGSRIEVSMHEAALAWLTLAAPTALVDGAVGELPLTGKYACYNVYECADGRWLALGALESKFWETFCQRIGHPEWIPPQFEPGAQGDVITGVQSVMRTQPRDAWLARFADADVTLSPVQSVREALADPHTRARQAVSSAGGSIHLASPLRIGGAGQPFIRPDSITRAPRLGEHSEEVLREAGLTASQIAAIRRRT